MFFYLNQNVITNIYGNSIIHYHIIFKLNQITIPTYEYSTKGKILTLLFIEQEIFLSLSYNNFICFIKIFLCDHISNRRKIINIIYSILNTYFF